MPKLKFGTLHQVSFNNLNDYYYALGFLANSNNAEIKWEKNDEQGAWGSEGRIHCLVPKSEFPQFFKFTAGRGSVFARINCNDYVGCLIYDHNFVANTRDQDVSAIIQTVPPTYQDVFWKGYRKN